MAYPYGDERRMGGQSSQVVDSTTHNHRGATLFGSDLPLPRLELAQGADVLWAESWIRTLNRVLALVGVTKRAAHIPPAVCPSGAACLKANAVLEQRMRGMQATVTTSLPID